MKVLLALVLLFIALSDASSNKKAEGLYLNLFNLGHCSMMGQTLFQALWALEGSRSGTGLVSYQTFDKFKRTRLCLLTVLLFDEFYSFFNQKVREIERETEGALCVLYCSSIT